MSFQEGVGAMSYFRELTKLREGLGSLAERAQPTESCFEPEKIWEAVQGEAKPDELRELVDHMSTCMVCAEAWEVAEEVSTSQAQTQSVSQPSPPAVSTRRSWWLSSAAAVILFMVGAQWLPWQEWQLGPGFRGGDEKTIRSLLVEGEPPLRQNCLLRWQGPEDALTYDVRVTWVSTEERRVVFEAKNLAATELLIPEHRLRDLPADARLIWRVQAFNGDQELAAGSFALSLE